MNVATNPEYLHPGDDEEEVVTTNSSITAIEEADRSHQIATARKYPRKISEFVKDITELSTLSQDTAAAMIYSLPRANKQIVGPSIRFAEAVLACWGNARAGVEVVDVDKKEGIVTAEGRYYDCEKNVGIALRKRRRIVAKTINADSIQVTGDAISSIALRDAILRSVPKALWGPAWERAKATAAGDAKSMAQIREGMLQIFRTHGVTDVQIYNALSEYGTVISGPADLGPDQILAMQAWHKQLKEGESTLEDIFGSPLDEEIEHLMSELTWSETKKRMSRDNYKGRREEHLNYLRGLAQQAGKPVGEKITPIKQPAQKAEPAVSQESKPAVDTVDKHPEQQPINGADMFGQQQTQQAQTQAQPQGAKRKPAW